MLILIAALASDALPYPEQTPQFIEACLHDAVENDFVEVTGDSHKYMCTGPAAEHFWQFLEDAKIDPYEQNAGDDGFWLSRDFPLGGCFKRTRLPDGTPATSGLSCSIWIPRVVRSESGRDRETGNTK